MAGKKSRDKGNRFELKIANDLTRIVEGLEFRRAPLSGGWADSPHVAGDVICINPGPTSFPFCIECKNEEGWKLESLFTDKHAWFDAWWEQVVDECPEGFTPILVFTRNRIPAFVVFQYHAFSHADNPGNDPITVLDLYFGDDMVIMLWEDLLNWFGKRFSIRGTDNDQ